jgi:hypothetical protein
MLAQALEVPSIDEGRDGLMATAHERLVREWPIEPPPQLTGAHGRRALIQEREQGRLRMPA